MGLGGSFCTPALAGTPFPGGEGVGTQGWH